MFGLGSRDVASLIVNNKYEEREKNQFYCSVRRTLEKTVPPRMASGHVDLAHPQVEKILDIQFKYGKVRHRANNDIRPRHTTFQ